MALTAEEKQLCAEWLTEPARKWQVLNRSQWKYQFHEKTLVRFVEEATMDESLVPLLLEYLTSDDCKSTIQLYGQAVSSEWAPTRAWYEISNKAVGNLKAVRLYHALSIEPENGEDGPYLVEDGCAYKVSLTYHWRQESVPRVPASESGISYHIINLSRDPENGLYSYAIEKRERVQQDIPEYVTGVTTTHETREEVHHGVRGELDAGGKQASVGGGKIVRRKVTKNADCTHDVHNETVKELASPKHSESVSVGLTGTVKTTTDLNMPEPLPTDGLDIGQHVENTKTEGGLWRRVFRKLVPNALIRIAESCRKTLFAHSHSNTTVQSNDPGFSHVEEAGGGVVHDKRVSRTADGAYQITDSTTIEKPVQKSHEAVHVGLSGKTRSVTHRNQSSPAPEPTDIGESVENSRTEGGLWNVTIRTLVKNALIKIGDACSKTVFQHSHSNTKVQSSDPGESNVSSASGGVIHERRVSRTADGAFQINDSTTTELPVGDASESTSIGLEGTVKTTQRRNQPNKAPDPTDIGEVVENTKTPGGLWNHTIRKRVLKSLVKLGENCRKTFFSHSHSKSIVQGSDPGFDHVAEAGNGKVVSKSVTRTSTGAFRVEENETTEKPVRDAVVEIAKTLRGTRKTVTHKSQQDAVSEVGLKIGERRSTRKTDGGLNDNTISTPTGESAGKIAKGESKTVFEDVETERENIAAGGELPSRSADSAGDGKTHSVDVHLNEDGSADVIKRDKTEKAVADAGEIINVSLEGKTKTVIKRNQSAKEPEPGDNEIGKSVENMKTEGGRWNTKVRTVVRGALLRLGEACRKSIFEHRHSKTTVQSDDPGFDHVAEAGNGKVVSKSVTRTSTGAFRVEENETTEKPVDKARETFNVGLSGLVRTETKRNQATPEPKPSAKDIGKKVENVKTEGGRFDVTISEIEPGQKVKTDESCRKTLTHHVHSKTEVQSDDPGFDHVAEAADGVLHEKRVSRTADGAYRVDETETTEKPVDKARKAKRMTLAGLVEEETNLYQNSKGDDNVQKVGESHSFEKTPGKGYNVTVVKKPTKGAGKIADSCSADRYLHRHVKTDNKLADGDPDAETSFEHGKITRKTKTLTALGTQNEVVEELTPKYHLDRTHWTDPVTGITYWTIKYRNAENEYKDFPSNAVNVVLNDTVNEFDLHDGILRYQIGRSYSASSTDLKFNKHGAAQVYYDVEHRRRTRVWSHRKWEVKARRIRGDMYTDYISELARANPERTSPGTLAVRLIEKYNDRDGNLLAEWVQVDLVQAEAWSVCTQGCVGKHEFAVVRWNMDHHFIINGLLQSI